MGASYVEICQEILESQFEKEVQTHRLQTFSVIEFKSSSECRQSGLGLGSLVFCLHPNNVLPPCYSPALNKDRGLDRNNVIGTYFLQGFTNAEIAGLLALQHGILSVRTVKRILKRMRLKRAGCNNESPLDQIVRSILDELENSCGSFMGYRQLTRRLRRKYNLHVRRDTIMKYLCIIDPEGVEHCKRPIDSFSRRILWLEVNSTNKKPSVIASHYLDTVQQLEGVPRRMRCDRGTENTIIGNLQQFFRWYDDDDFAGSKSFVQGKSSANQRIESWWSKFQKGGGGWWINLFKDLRDCGLYRDDYLTKECLKFCFLPILRQELHLVVELWNTHNIQRQKRGEVEGGKPDIMFFTPEIYGTHSYLVNVDIEDVNACKEMYAESCVDYNEDLEELVRLVKPDYVPPSNEYEALQLYSEITELWW
ncbi:hypothetical protein OS493_033416 [Desmophyllum pertusum]|uniref:Integrase core domain-containing protein n=1 Tax=Desmophyllum pertusum TaxID=174260 RepID=A0A9W9Y841_9CNID|nr:hypothetical protein OS493_033416 [Desmophyllum pertusum]